VVSLTSLSNKLKLRYSGYPTQPNYFGNHGGFELCLLDLEKRNVIEDGEEDDVNDQNHQNWERHMVSPPVWAEVGYTEVQFESGLNLTSDHVNGRGGPGPHGVDLLHQTPYAVPGGQLLEVSQNSLYER
jgi:hypothetical protein